jgi:hypothetical protein
MSNIDYYSSLNDIQTSFDIVIDKMRNNYVDFKLHENEISNQYKSNYENDNDELKNIFDADIFILKNNLETNISKKNIYIQNKSDQINSLQKEVSQLKSKYNNLLLGDKASYGLNVQQEDLYILNRYDIFLNLFCIFIISVITIKAYNQKFELNDKIIQQSPQPQS